MNGITFYILDVFAEEKYAGNQLAVFVDAASLSDAEMQRIAKEMNFSETTFILSRKQRAGGYDIRIFTPQAEVPFAGHPTLGTAYVLQSEIIAKPAEKIILNLKVGQIPVTFDRDSRKGSVLWMKQKEPIFSSKVKPPLIAQVLGLDEKDIDGRFPIQEVSTGLPCIIVPLKTAKAIKRIKVDLNKCYRLIAKKRAKTILVFCPQPMDKDNDLKVRFFADFYGVPEDPATGSANGCLAGYLVKHRYFGTKKIDVRVEQGYEIGRPSLLRLKAENRDGKIEVRVGGHVVLVAKGKLV